MQPMFRFGTPATRLHALIRDLRWRVQLINADIHEEEQRARVFDTADPSYPALALNLRARRDNVVATIATLEGRLKAIQPAPDRGHAA